MECIFDSCELINGIVFGLGTSFLASYITFLFVKGFEKSKNKKRYGKLTGTYTGFVMTDSAKRIVSETPSSKASIKHEKDNLLSIHVTDFSGSNHNLWEGTIYMESESKGHMTWYYKKHEDLVLSENKHLFGFKRVITRVVNESLFVYVLEEKLSEGSENFPNEVFIKTK